MSQNGGNVVTQIPIPVIASFTTTGYISPLYVRIDGIALKVESFWTKPGFFRTSVFSVTLIDGDYRKNIEITYHHDNQTWTRPPYDEHILGIYSK